MRYASIPNRDRSAPITTPHQNPSAAASRRRQNNPRGQGGRLREELIAAASAMVSGAGNASQLSMRAVAAEVGVAATSVYLHFTDIDELKVAVAERGFADLARVRDAALAEIDDPAEALVARCLTYAQFGLAHPGQYRLMFGSELSASVFTQAYDAENSAIRSAYDALTDAIRRCQQSGAAPDDADPVLLAALLWPALHGQVSMRIDRPHFPRPPLDEVITQTVKRLVGLELTVPRDGARP